MTKLDEFLEHHGIKGQKWGVRRKRGSSGRVDPLANTKHLSNDELRKLVDRMRLEQQFTELSKPKAKAGSKLAKSVVKQHGNKVVSAVIGTAVGATARAIKSAFDFR